MPLLLLLYKYNPLPLPFSPQLPSRPSVVPGANSTLPTGGGERASDSTTRIMADALLRSVYHGCIAGCDAGIERRPYHKNCTCALHDRGTIRCSQAKSNHHTVSYPIRRAWSEGSLLAMVASGSGISSSPSSPPSTEVAVTGRHHQLGFNEEEEQHIGANRRREIF